MVFSGRKIEFTTDDWTVFGASINFCAGVKFTGIKMHISIFDIWFQVSEEEDWKIIIKKKNPQSLQNRTVISLLCMNLGSMFILCYNILYILQLALFGWNFVTQFHTHELIFKNRQSVMCHVRSKGRIDEILSLQELIFLYVCIQNWTWLICWILCNSWDF